jgi:hypothetical protein
MKGRSVRKSIIVSFAAGLVVVLSMVLLVNVFHATLTDAIQAAATVVLVIVTGTYAWSTNELVRLQAQPERVFRAQIREQNLADLSRELEGIGDLLYRVAGRYPLKVKDKEPPEFGEGETERLSAFDARIRGLVYGLTPDLVTRILVLTERIEEGVNQIRKLQLTVLAETIVADEEHRDWSADRARDTYYTRIRGGVRLWEWEELLEGKPIRDAYSTVEDLRSRLIAEAAFDPLPKRPAGAPSTDQAGNP